MMRRGGAAVKKVMLPLTMTGGEEEEEPISILEEEEKRGRLGCSRPRRSGRPRPRTPILAAVSLNRTDCLFSLNDGHLWAGL